jgi:hypothetical protein
MLGELPPSPCCLCHAVAGDCLERELVMGWGHGIRMCSQ